MQKFHHLRALALLGALILYLFLWPIYCCAAKPAWSPLATDVDMQISTTTHEIGGNGANQTYQNSMTATGISDNASTNDKLVDLFKAPNGNNPEAYDRDKANKEHQADETMYEIVDNSQVSNAEYQSVKAETMTSSIYELFDFSKSRSKSNNQILSRTDRSVHLNSSNSKNNSVSGAKRVKNNKTKLSTLERNERSANLSHITGSARKIQLYIKNRFLQLLPDGTVNGTTEDMSDYSKLIIFTFHLTSELRLSEPTHSQSIMNALVAVQVCRLLNIFTRKILSAIAT